MKTVRRKAAILNDYLLGHRFSETRWGQALDPAYFPPENIIPFSKVRIVSDGNRWQPSFDRALAHIAIGSICWWSRLHVGPARLQSRPVDLVSTHRLTRQGVSVCDLWRDGGLCLQSDHLHARYHPGLSSGALPNLNDFSENETLESL